MLFVLGERLIWTNEKWLHFLAVYAPRGLCDVSRTTARIRLARERGDPLLVILGSSQVVQGIDCDLLAREEGRPCLNLGVNGGSPLDALFLLDRLGPGPRVTILGLFPRILHTGPKRAFTNLDTLRCVSRAGALSRLDWDDWRLLLFGELQDLSETFRNKDSLNRLGTALGDDLPRAWHGELPPPSEYILPDEPSPNYLEHVEVQTFSPAQDQAVNLLVERERALGNPFVLVDFPRREGYEQHVTPEAEERYRAVFARFSNVPGVRVLGASDLPSFSDQDFMDMTHLRPEGREVLSRRLAAILEQTAPRPTSSR